MRASSMLRAAAVMFIGTLAAGCADPADDSSATSAAGDISTVAVSAPLTEAGTTMTTSATTSETTSETTSSEIDPGLQPYIDIAVDDLATRLAADVGGITVVSATLVVWPDSALGCPAPGQEYATVATDGALIILELDGTEYRYHAGGSRAPFLCEKPGKSLTGTVSTGL
ncbi:MAG TPA: hypothetical protein PLQ10_04920 [Ilumatobacteraceae bacterium]|nr:hypothetical protein [Ilumatobacteraceae bacterium]